MPTFGEEIRRERELREINLREVAEATKINLRFLEALEGNQFEHLPGGLFNRGFVRAYAEYIGCDPEAMVNAYLLEEQNQDRAAKSGKERRVSPLAQSGAERTLAVDSRRLWRWVLIFVCAAVLAGAAWGLVRVFRVGPGDAAAAPSTPAAPQGGDLD